MSAAAKTAAPELVTRFVGACQICEATWKLTPAPHRLVHHGYKRPGHGEIEGDCWGVGHAPWELSCEAAKAFVLLLETKRMQRRERIASLQSGAVTYLTRPVGSWRRVAEWLQFAVGVTAPHLWEREIAERIGDCEADIKRTTRTIDYMTQRIAAWAPAPIRTVDEIAAQVVVDKAARAAVRAEARAQRDAKRAATRAKQDALKARRVDILVNLGASLRLAAAEKGDAGVAMALSALRTMRKHSWFTLYSDLASDDVTALESLRLATRRERGGADFHPLTWNAIRR